MTAQKLNTFARLRELDLAKSLLIATALTQRMAVNAVLYFSSTKNSDALSHIDKVLDGLWDVCLKRRKKLNAESLLDKLETFIPDPEKDDNIASFSVVDFCVALSTCVYATQKEEDNPAVVVAKLSQGDIERFLRITGGRDMSTQELRETPLFTYEIDIVESFLAFVESDDLAIEDIADFRAFIVDQDLSNLGLASDI
ncbi:DUF416 family protein [Agaribacter flavus]|uniref:DUF416 family protein n=1 Tax=Agaribacter flavus TaxID=1902781 RepID=A0ABV7FQJ2_9ALTE